LRNPTRAILAGLCLSVLCLGALHAALIPRFLGLDEFSYYATVKYYAAHHAMPVLGHPGVSYEAQMGPGYYVPTALIYRLFAPLGGGTAFYAVRAFNVALLPVLTLLAFGLGRQIRPDDDFVALGAAVLVGLNPHLLALGGIAYNDLLSIILGMWAVYLFVTWFEQDRLGPGRGLVVGLVIALAIITKPSTLFIAAALPMAIIVLRHRAGLSSMVSIAIGVLIGSGWWFIRNLHLYGELGTRTGLARVHFPLARGSLNANQVYSFAISNWGPSDTFGKTFHLPGEVKLVAVLVTAAALYGWLIKRRSVLARARPEVALTYGFVFVLSIAAYVYADLRIISVSPRVVFGAYFVVALVLALGLRAALGERSERGHMAALGLLSGVLVLAAIADLGAVRM
jgi:D-alanyl-D-alanine carboxypeptidase (penicillin-binding protein 5/6)